MAAGAGSNVSLTLYFLRFALAMNLALCLVWLACTVVPFMIWPPGLFAWASFRDYLPLQLLQGYGLHNTFLLYGAALGSEWPWTAQMCAWPLGMISERRSSAAWACCTAPALVAQPREGDSLHTGATHCARFPSRKQSQ